MERISFDEFGCLNIGNSENTLSKAETNIFEKEIKKIKIDEKKMKPLVLKLIRMNQEKIGSDILFNYYREFTKNIPFTRQCNTY